MGSANSHQLIRKGKSITIAFVGIDLAKTERVCRTRGEHGRQSRDGAAERAARQAARTDRGAACMHDRMEACSGAHHWAGRFQALGHTVKLMAPKFVPPYRLSGKRGKNDAVICGVRSCNHTTSLGAGWGQGQSNVRDCKT